ncbi:MAG: dienelactone hydrolase family protein [Rhizobacter sp.]
MKFPRRLGIFWLLGLLVGPAAAGAVVSFPSLDAPAGQAIQLKADWHPVDGPKAGAIVMLHGCGGAYGREGQPSERTREYTQLFNAQGFHVLVLDSFGPRGEREICTQRTGTRRITMANRRPDALAALRWLAQQPGVDAQKLGFIGWSNGGSTVLSATNLLHREVATSSPKPAFAIAFYPGCESDLKRGYKPSAPLLMLVGEADDWTPAAPCHQLAKASAEPRPQIEGYAGAYHGFDSSAPVRLRRDVPNGTNPGQGVHVGGQPEALAASRARLLQFLQAHVTRP